MIPWHLGAMHPFEQALTFALAFGPFLVLGIVIAIRRRMDGSRRSASRQRRVSG